MMEMVPDIISLAEQFPSSFSPAGPASKDIWTTNRNPDFADLVIASVSESDTR